MIDNFDKICEILEESYLPQLYWSRSTVLREHRLGSVEENDTLKKIEMGILYSRDDLIRMNLSMHRKSWDC